MSLTTTSRTSASVAIALSLLLPAAARADDAAKKTVAPVGPRGAPVALAAPKDFADAVAAVEKATGTKGEKMRVGEIPLADGRSFAVEPALAERLLEGSHATFRKAGLFLFRYERSFGMAGDKDQLGLLKTADANAVIRRVGTSGAHHQITSDRIVAWLDALAKDEPFDVYEVGVDYLAGRFERKPKDPDALAKRCAEFAPDLVAGRASTLELLAHEIGANRTLYLIW